MFQFKKLSGNFIGPCFRVWCFNDSGYSRRYSVSNQGTFPQNRILMLRLLFAITWKYWLYNKRYFILQSNGCSARAREIIPDPIVESGRYNIRNLDLGSHENVFKSYDQFLCHISLSVRGLIFWKCKNIILDYRFTCHKQKLYSEYRDGKPN